MIILADRLFQNIGSMDGSYAGMPFEDSLSSELQVLIAEVPFEKTADQDVWFSGNLTITFTIDNTEGEGPLETIVISDSLDNTIFNYIEGSLIARITDASAEVIDLELDTDYTVTITRNSPEETTDTLEIAFLAGGAAESIPVGSIVTISFLGSKVPATP